MNGGIFRCINRILKYISLLSQMPMDSLVEVRPKKSACSIQVDKFIKLRFSTFSLLDLFLVANGFILLLLLSPLSAKPVPNSPRNALCLQSEKLPKLRLLELWPE